MTKLGWTKRKGKDTTYTANCAGIQATLFYSEQPKPGSDEIQRFWLLYMAPVLSGVAIQATTEEEALEASEREITSRLPLMIQHLTKALELLIPAPTTTQPQ